VVKIASQNIRKRQNPIKSVRQRERKDESINKGEKVARYEAIRMGIELTKVVEIHQILL